MRFFAICQPLFKLVYALAKLVICFLLQLRLKCIDLFKDHAITIQLFFDGITEHFFDDVFKHAASIVSPSMRKVSLTRGVL